MLPNKKSCLYSQYIFHIKSALNKCKLEAKMKKKAKSKLETAKMFCLK